MPRDDIETLRLPLSGLLYQRQADNSWRCLPQDQYDAEVTGRFADPDAWISAHLAVSNGARAQRAAGFNDQPSWWLLYGDTRKGPVKVRLADGRTPPILTFGPLWICEWVSLRQEAVATTGDGSWTAFRRVPHY